MPQKINTPLTHILVRGARCHNLKNIDIDIPKSSLVVFSGLSGSGKSSLAFDTIFAEGQRRYVESLSAYARQFLQIMDKPDVDVIEGLTPTISIDQKSVSHNPRSTVGTVTEIHDYLRLLFARIGIAHCPTHNIKLQKQTTRNLTDFILENFLDCKVAILAPIITERKGEYQDLLTRLDAHGFARVRVDGKIYPTSDAPELTKNIKHNIEAVIDRLTISTQASQRIIEAVDLARRHGQGRLIVLDLNNNQQKTLSASQSCPKCSYAPPEIEPKMFSFNNPNSACSKCMGLGIVNEIDPNELITNPELSLNDGVLYGITRYHSKMYAEMKLLLNSTKNILNRPWQTLSQAEQGYILYGNKPNKKYPDFIGYITYLEHIFHEMPDSNNNIGRFFSKRTCDKCKGGKLKDDALAIKVNEHSIVDLSLYSLEKLQNFIETIDLNEAEQKISDRIIREIKNRVGFLVNVGLEYLSLWRQANTLSGGELQRIRLASQIGSGLTGVTYVLDEPSIGLHQRDNRRLLDTLFHLRDLGNNVLIIEHDEETLRSADYIVDVGPLAGELGGEIIDCGKPQQFIRKQKSLTAKYLSGKEQVCPPNLTPRVINPKKVLEISGININNLEDVTVKFPLGLFIGVAGVSGSGKSSLINECLGQLLHRYTLNYHYADANYTKATGLEHVQRAIIIDQSPIGRTPRSNPATYTGIFNHIRDMFCKLPLSRQRGYKPGQFSFNVPGGRCEICKGDGMRKVEMHFLPDVYVRCDECSGKRFKDETLEVQYRDKNIHDVLQMTIDNAADFFSSIPQIAKKIKTLQDVGLGYIRLGQSATTLSGGEGQRVKLSLELTKSTTFHCCYILDEPTTGLHFHDVKKLLEVLHNLVELNNTVIVIEHQIDVLRSADYIIELGPSGGAKGGEIISTGPPEKISATKDSPTGVFLRPYFAKNKKQA